MISKHKKNILMKLSELCPAAVQNGKVDFERLKAELSDVIDENVQETLYLMSSEEDWRDISANVSLPDCSDSLNW